MKKGFKNWRELIIQRCAIKLRLKHAWANFTSRKPTVTCKDITVLLDQLEHMDTLIEMEKSVDINNRVPDAGTSLCNYDPSRHSL